MGFDSFQISMLTEQNRALRVELDQLWEIVNSYLPDIAEIDHADDFTWLRVGSKVYHFTKGNQAMAVGYLYETWNAAGGEDGCGAGEEAIGEAIGSEGKFRMANTFRKHSALGTIIRSAGKGVFALYLNEALPSDQETSE